MIGSQLPGLNGFFSNSLALNRELGRAIGFIQVARSKGYEPAGAAKLIVLLDAAKALVTAGTVTPLTFSTPLAATRSIAVGASFSLTAVVAAGGTGAKTYVWRKDGVVLPAFTTAGPHLVNATAAVGDSGTYTVTVTDALGAEAVSQSVVTVA